MSTKSQDTPVTTPTSDQNKETLQQITHQIYEQNVELSLRNRTLSLVQEIYQIINTALGIRTTAQRIIDSVVKGLNFQDGFIALVDKRKKELHVIAFARSTHIHYKRGEKLEKVVKHFTISLKEKDNHCVQSVLEKEKRMTNELHDILAPLVDEKTAAEIQAKCNIQTCLLYPLMFAQDVFGLMVIGVDRHIGFLSRAERDALKELVNVVSIALERSQIYSALKNANERLKKLDQLKDEFVSIASHELRTPMTAIKSYLWMALNKAPEPLRPEVQRYLDIAYHSTERLIHLVQDMLTVSRIEGKRLQINVTQVNLGEMLRMLYDELMIKMDEKEISFKAVTPDGSHPHDTFVEGDKDKLREVFQNLVGNALKFTPEKGEIKIIFDDQKHMVSIAVSDTGPGILPEDKDKLFQKFGKFQHAYEKLTNVSGTGLGLYITKQIVNLHGGDITVKSAVDKGTTFTVVLPKEQAKKPNRATG